MVTLSGTVTLLVTTTLFLLVTPSILLRHVRASSLPEEPRCEFPKFLQTKKNKQWMMDQLNSFTTFDVEGGKIFARSGRCVRSRDYPRRRHSGMAECIKSNYTRLCLEIRPGNKYLVRHVESDFQNRFVCLEFLTRGISVVQLKMSPIQEESGVPYLCSESFMNVDPWPWISEEYYRSPPVKCPFSGGYNLQLKHYFPPAAGSYRPYTSSFQSSTSSHSPHLPDNAAQDCTGSSSPTIRMESDCVAREGVVFNFKHLSCLPSGTHLALDQRALCMATWQNGQEMFAMLRAANNDRAFFCLRIKPLPTAKIPHRSGLGVSADHNLQIDEVVLYIGWVCPTSSYDDTISRYSGSRSSFSPNRTPHMVFSVQDQKVVTEPCSDELNACYNHTVFCRHLQCMLTCGKCEASDLPSESENVLQLSKKATMVLDDRFAGRYHKDSERGLVLAGEDDGESQTQTDDHDNTERSSAQEKHRRECRFPASMQGTWLQRNLVGYDEKIVISETTFHHPRLGSMECVTFRSSNSQATPLRRVLWSRYDNGCYPRFTCLQYNTPAKSVMRYRLANIQHWPLELSDDSICEETQFMEPPDLYQPADKYSPRSWEFVRRAGHIHKVACILPHYLPKVVSFLDDRGNSGCLVHSTYYSPRAISLTYFPKASFSPNIRSIDVGTDYGQPLLGSEEEHSAYGRHKAETRTPNDGKAPWESQQDGNYPTFTAREYGLHSRQKVYSRKRDGDDVRVDQDRRSDDLRVDQDRRSDDVRVDQDRESDDSGVEYGQRTGEVHQFPPGREEIEVNKTHEVYIDGGSESDLKSYYHYASSQYEHSSDKPYSQSGPSEYGHLRRFHRNKRSANSSPDNEVNFHTQNQRVRRNEDEVTSRLQFSYECLAVMTYVDSYKSLLTVTTGNPNEVLCWLVVDELTVVILKTSSCNSQTAQQVLTHSDHNVQHLEQVHRILHLRNGDRNCSSLYPTDQARPQPIVSESDKKGSGATSSLLTSKMWTQFAAVCLILTVGTFLLLDL